MERITVFQINPERDRNGMNGKDFSDWPRGAVDASIYDRVFDGSLPVDGIENAVARINSDPPKDYFGTAIYPSTVISRWNGETGKQEVLYVCEFGYENLRSFKATESGERTEKPEMRKAASVNAVLVEPLKEPRVIRVADSAAGMSEYLEDYTYDFIDEPHDIIRVFRKQGKALGLPLNRAFFAPPGWQTCSFDNLCYYMYGCLKTNPEKIQTAFLFFEKNGGKRKIEVYGDSPAFDFDNYADVVNGSYKNRRYAFALTRESGYECVLNGRVAITECGIPRPHEVIDVLAGPFVIAKISSDRKDILNLQNDEIEKYMTRFRRPERFVWVKNSLKVIRDGETVN